MTDDHLDAIRRNRSLADELEFTSRFSSGLSENAHTTHVPASTFCHRSCAQAQPRQRRERVLLRWLSIQPLSQPGRRHFLKGRNRRQNVSIRKLCPQGDFREGFGGSHEHGVTYPRCLGCYGPEAATGRNVRIVHLVSPERPAVPRHWRKRAAHPNNATSVGPGENIGWRRLAARSRISTVEK